MLVLVYRGRVSRSIVGLAEHARTRPRDCGKRFRVDRCEAHRYGKRFCVGWFVAVNHRYGEGCCVVWFVAGNHRCGKGFCVDWFVAGNRRCGEGCCVSRFVAGNHGSVTVLFRGGVGTVD